MLICVALMYSIHCTICLFVRILYVYMSYLRAEHVIFGRRRGGPYYNGCSCCPWEQVGMYRKAFGWENRQCYQESLEFHSEASTLQRWSMQTWCFCGEECPGGVQGSFRRILAFKRSQFIHSYGCKGRSCANSYRNICWGMAHPSPRSVL